MNLVCLEQAILLRRAIHFCRCTVVFCRVGVCRTALRSAALRGWHTDVLWRRHDGARGGLIEFELAIQVGRFDGRGSGWQADLVERVDRERLRCNVPDGPRSTYSLTPFPS